MTPSSPSCSVQVLVTWFDEVEPGVFVLTGKRDRIAAASIHPEPVSMVPLEGGRYKMRVTDEMAKCLHDYKEQASRSRKATRQHVLPQ